ncbi:unnamed protein product [Ectocarpus fasciculatus]
MVCERQGLLCTKYNTAVSRRFARPLQLLYVPTPRYSPPRVRLSLLQRDGGLMLPPSVLMNDCQRVFQTTTSKCTSKIIDERLKVLRFVHRYIAPPLWTAIQ